MVSRPSKGIVDDAPHERVLVAQGQALRQQPDALVLDAAGQADAIGEQRGDDPGRRIHDYRKLHLRDDCRRFEAEDDAPPCRPARRPMTRRGSAIPRRRRSASVINAASSLGARCRSRPCSSEIGRQGLGEERPAARAGSAPTCCRPVPSRWRRRGYDCRARRRDRSCHAGRW